MQSKPQDKKTEIQEELCFILQGEKDCVGHWLGKLTEASKNIDTFTSVVFLDKEEKQKRTISVLPQLFHILQDCILNHRWKEVLAVLHKIIQVPQGTSQTIWKVGSELLQMDGDENRDLFQHLYNQMKILADLNSKDVMLDFVAYLLSVDENKEALSVMQERIKRHGIKKEKSSRDEYVDMLHQAYLGFLWYIEWKICGKTLDNMQTEYVDQIFSLASSRSHGLLVQRDNFATKAISCFQEIWDQPGVWDIFITKHVELLIWQEKKDEALDVLQKYCMNNEDSLNAHKYLYEFYRDHYQGDEEKMNILHVIARLSPSDPLVMELCLNLLEEKGVDAVSYIFNLLDYPCWQRNVIPWEILATILQDAIYKRSVNAVQLKETIERCWEPRSSWWPAFHFTDYMASAATEHRLKYYVSIVAVCLCGKDNQYFQKANKDFSTDEMKQLLEIEQLCHQAVS